MAEDLRPVSEVEAAVKFRPTGQAREQVVVHSSGRRPGSRWFKGDAVILSVHPDVPDALFAPPGRGLGIRHQWAGGRSVVPRGRGSGC